jgi:16S rRNA (guanine527-N7)-methyltransferase
MTMEILQAGAQHLGLSLTARHLALFETYYRELSAWNERMNLTAITAYEEVQRRHFVDSLTCLLAISHDGQSEVPNTVPLQVRTRPLWLLDVGSGAGFPGLPLKIMLPEAKVTLVEATQKKVRFLEHMVQLLGLKDVEVLNARAEDAGRLEQHRERYDVVVARAVAHLAVLAEYCLPLCRVGGRMIAPKGEDARQEAEESAQALMTLGGELVAIKPVVLPDFPEERYLIVVGKRARTPNAYPRRAGVPSKNPLM